MVPDDRKYTQEHEWILIEDGVGAIGVTEFGAFVEILPGHRHEFACRILCDPAIHLRTWLVPRRQFELHAGPRSLNDLG